MKLLIVRHGDPDYTIDSLTEKGWREARYLAQKLSKLEIKDHSMGLASPGLDNGREILSV